MSKAELEAEVRKLEQEGKESRRLVKKPKTKEDTYKKGHKRRVNRGEVKNDLNRMSLREVAKKHHIPWTYAWRIKYSELRDEPKKPKK